MPGYADFLGTCLRQPVRANLFPWSHNLEIFENRWSILDRSVLYVQRYCGREKHQVPLTLSDGGLLKTQEFALSLSILSGYGCQFINLRKGIEQKLPDSVTGLVSIGYSPFNYNKVVKIKPVQQGTDIEELTWPWWGGSLSLRLDGEGYLYLKQTMWDSMIFRVTSL